MRVQVWLSGQLLIHAHVYLKVIQNHTLTLNFVKKNHKHLKNNLELQSRTINIDKKNSKIST